MALIGVVLDTQRQEFTAPGLAQQRFALVHAAGLDQRFGKGDAAAAGGRLMGLEPGDDERGCQAAIADLGLGFGADETVARPVVQLAQRHVQFQKARAVIAQRHAPQEDVARRGVGQLFADPAHRVPIVVIGSIQTAAETGKVRIRQILGKIHRFRPHARGRHLGVGCRHGKGDEHHCGEATRDHGSNNTF